jgi:hypothetical protein
VKLISLPQNQVLVDNNRSAEPLLAPSHCPLASWETDTQTNGLGRVEPGSRLDLGLGCITN